MKRNAKLDAAWVEESFSRVLRAAVASWEWGEIDGEPVTFKGEQPDATPENVAQVFDELPWVEDQVREAFNDDEGFFTG